MANGLFLRNLATTKRSREPHYINTNFGVLDGGGNACAHCVPRACKVAVAIRLFRILLFLSFGVCLCCAHRAKHAELAHPPTNSLLNINVRRTHYTPLSLFLLGEVSKTKPTRNIQGGRAGSEEALSTQADETCQSKLTTNPLRCTTDRNTAASGATAAH